jgi:hypothetical protein
MSSDHLNSFDFGEEHARGHGVTAFIFAINGELDRTIAQYSITGQRKAGDPGVD